MVVAIYSLLVGMIGAWQLANPLMGLEDAGAKGTKFEAGPSGFGATDGLGFRILKQKHPAGKRVVGKVYKAQISNLGAHNVDQLHTSVLKYGVELLQ